MLGNRQKIAACFLTAWAKKGRKSRRTSGSDWFGVVFTWFEGGLCSPSNPYQLGKKVGLLFDEHPSFLFQFIHTEKTAASQYKVYGKAKSTKVRMDWKWNRSSAGSRRASISRRAPQESPIHLRGTNELEKE
ncbi:MAG: hypothetical protein LBL72_02075 [Candidatus Accumulibacter sp.]|nr:hypothetical protein [Accumulibacter sp.]